MSGLAPCRQEQLLQLCHLTLMEYSSRVALLRQGTDAHLGSLGPFAGTAAAAAGDVASVSRYTEQGSLHATPGAQLGEQVPSCALCLLAFLTSAKWCSGAIAPTRILASDHESVLWGRLLHTSQGLLTASLGTESPSLRPAYSCPYLQNTCNWEASCAFLNTEEDSSAGCDLLALV